jgi:hypothetical protein
MVTSSQAICAKRQRIISNDFGFHAGREECTGSAQIHLVDSEIIREPSVFRSAVGRIVSRKIVRGAGDSDLDIAASLMSTFFLPYMHV